MSLPTPYYQSENVTLYCGDCLSILPLLAPGSVDAVVTDPPYFQPAAHYCPTRDGGAPRKTIGDMSILEHFFREFIGGCAAAVAADGAMYVFCDGQSYAIAFTGMYPRTKRVRPLIWDKVTSFNGYTWRHQHELIAWGEMTETSQVPTGDGDILRFRAVPVDERVHPAEKPAPLLDAIIGKTKSGGTILDAFAGSGSTGASAVRLGRKFIGIEIDEGYCAIAARRIKEAEEVGQMFREAKPVQTEIFAGAHE